MKKEMLINVLQPEECRIAIVEDGVLEELYVERTSHESYTGNIYKGKIVNLEPAIQAAFVDFSVGRNGFLHVSDIEPQYFERKAGATDEPGPGTRDRPPDRKREPRRDRERGRGRDDRRRPPPQSPHDPQAGPPPSAPPSPPRPDDRPRDRGRPPRDRDPERGRERERPDLSVKGRRDRAEPPPRRFGEGLVEQPVEPWPEPLSEIEPIAPEQPHSPFEDKAQNAPVERDVTPRSLWPELPERIWDDSASGGRQEPPGPKRPPERPFEREPERPLEHEPPREFARDLFPELPDEPQSRGPRTVEPFDPDLPPSRTQRPRNPGRASDTEGIARGRPDFPSPSRSGFGEAEPIDERTRERDLDPPGGREPRRGRGHGRGRGRPSPQSGDPGPGGLPGAEEFSSPELPPRIDAQESSGVPRIDDLPRSDEPPRRRGGRAAIRSRGGEWEEPRDPYPPAERPARAQSPPGEHEPDRHRGPAPPRPADPERRRPPEPREHTREHDRSRPHGRAGEPGYVPRRERLRSGEPAFGADLFPESAEWHEREDDPDAPSKIGARRPTWMTRTMPALPASPATRASQAPPVPIRGAAGAAAGAAATARAPAHGPSRRPVRHPILCSATTTTSPPSSSGRGRLPTNVRPWTKCLATSMSSTLRNHPEPGGNRSRTTSSAPTS